MPAVYHQEPVPEETLIDVDGPHVNTVPASFSEQTVQTDTQATRRDLENEDARRALAGATDRLKALERKRKSEGSIFELVKKSANNPVILSNFIGSAVIAGLIGFQGYRWFQNGVTSGLGAIAGVTAAVGLFGVADYFMTKLALDKYESRK